jgi:hypothetical protein
VRIVQREFECRGVYETTSGDRVGIFCAGDRWFIAWSYADPFTSVPQLVAISSEAEAIDAFTTSREGRDLAFDSRSEWLRGSV